MGASHIKKEFWMAVRPNISSLREISSWWRICHELPIFEDILDKNLLTEAIKLLPEDEITNETWSSWTKNISSSTSLKGKELFLPLRLALTGMNHGPEMASLLPLIGYEAILLRLEAALAKQ